MIYLLIYEFLYMKELIDNKIHLYMMSIIRLIASSRVEFSTCQDSIRVRILDLSIQVESRCSTQVFELSQRVEIEYQLEILDSTRQDMKINR